VSTDDRTSRQQQKNPQPGPTDPKAALRRRTPSRARGDGPPQLRAVTPVVSQFPDLVTAADVIMSKYRLRPKIIKLLRHCTGIKACAD
jgi:hypothetical protein